jgi:predicted secreted protein
MKSFKPPISRLLLCLLFVAPSIMASEEAKRYDQIHLSANAAMEIDNDTLSARLYAQQEGSELSRLADAVNRKITQAIELVKPSEDIRLQTLGYQTYPVYQQQRVTGWRVRQTLRIESQDAKKLSQLLSELQSNLALESLHYSISPQQRQAAEEQLIGEAIGAFQKRAALITKQLGRSDYRLIEMTINTGGQPVEPVPYRARMMAAEAAVAPPSLEAGTQTVRVEVNGTIELQVDQ